VHRPSARAGSRKTPRQAADTEIGAIWDAYEISDPLAANTCTIESPIGTFTYEASTLANPGETSGIVVQVRDAASREWLARAMRMPDGGGA